MLSMEEQVAIFEERMQLSFVQKYPNVGVALIMVAAQMFEHGETDIDKCFMLDNLVGEIVVKMGFVNRIEFDQKYTPQQLEQLILTLYKYAKLWSFS